MKQALPLSFSLPKGSSSQPTAWSDILARTMILAFALAPAMRGISQQPAQQAAVQPAQSAPPEGSNWQHVQALPLGTSINVKVRKSHVSCTLKSVDADSLTCIHGKDIVFERTEIKSITIQRRGRSTLIGAGIGGAALAIAGFAGTTGHSDVNFLREDRRSAAQSQPSLESAGEPSEPAWARAPTSRIPASIRRLERLSQSSKRKGPRKRAFLFLRAK